MMAEVKQLGQEIREAEGHEGRFCAMGAALMRLLFWLKFVYTYLGQSGGMRIEVDEAALPSEPVVPARLQVRNFHGVANALHVRRRVRALWSKNRRHAAPQ